MEHHRSLWNLNGTCVREWTLAQRTNDDLGPHATPDTSAPMDIGQVKDTEGKGKKGKKGKGKEKGNGMRDSGEAKERDDSFFCCRVRVLWQVGPQEVSVQEAEERSRRQTSGCSSSSGCNSESSPIISS